MRAGITVAAAVVLFAAVAAPMEQIHPSVSAALPPVAPGIHDLGRALHATSGYGLFRRMTGVGKHGEVARPEVIETSLTALL